MKISYNWLKNYVKTEHSPQRLSEILTSVGLEVEGIEKVEAIKGSLEGVVVGQVTSCHPHENADRLNVTTVDVGGEEELQIVCGAPNVAVGQKVAVATVGATLYPNPDESFKIKKSKIRGVESYGMICAEDELGLGTSHGGIMVLSDEAIVGQKAAEYFQLTEDYRIEIGLTPNRSDALGHIGVARDIVAFNRFHKLEKTNLKLPDTNDYEVLESGRKIRIQVDEQEACPRYLGCIISNVKVQDSPDWLKRSLNAIGLSPINNIVDVTNFVMHELGTPIHAFDLETIGDKIIVKYAKDGEKFTTLDNVERTLSSEDLMITDGKKSLAIAGVLGGVESGVSNDTTTIFIETAYFNPVIVRKTAKRQGLNTDASFRFERGVDYNLLEFALKRAATLIVQLAGGTISHEPIPFYPKKIESTKVLFNYSRCNELIGNKLDVDKVNEILNVLDIGILHNNGDHLKLQIPSYRVDVTREADVIEEILRIYGFNNIVTPQKWNINLFNQDFKNSEKETNTIADLLVSKGYFELMNNSLTANKFVEENGGEALSNEHSVFMLNPLSNDLDVLRQTLIFQGLTSIVHNKNRQNPDLKLFEFGKTYQKINNEYIENRRLSVFLTGNIEPEQWNSNQNKVSFYTMKGIVNSIFERLGLDKFVITQPLEKSILEDGIQLFLLKDKVGEIGWTSRKVSESLGLKQMVYIADLDWDMVLKLCNMNNVKFTPLPKTFAIRRDFSLLVDKNTTFKEIEGIARKTNRKLLQRVNLFDVYEGDKIPEGKKSYAVSFYFQDDEKTLKDEQIDKIMEDIHSQLKKQLRVTLR